jgi:membrane protease YdiL (CAAX protease family)
MRALSALILALVVCAVVFPLAPWAPQVAAWQQAGVPVLVAVALGLALAGWLLPAKAGYLADRSPHADARGLVNAMSWLLLVHPLLHLAILAWVAWRPDHQGLDLVLPSGPARLPMLSVIAVVVIAPLVEEFFFRGRLLPWLMERVGTISAISLSACWFAAVHGRPVQAVVALPLGILLGLLWLRHRRLAPVVAVHGVHNALLVVLGGSLISSAVLALPMAMAGVVCLVAAHLPISRRRRLCLLVGLLALLIVTALHKPYSQAKDKLWLDAGTRLLSHPGIDADGVTMRLDSNGRRILSGDRRAALTAFVRDLPEGERRTWLLALLDPAALAREADENPFGIYQELRRLSAYPMTSQHLGVAVLHLAAIDPVALADLAREDPAGFAALVPVSRYRTDLVSVLTVLPTRHRLGMVESIRMAWDRSIASELHLALPPGAIGPRDRYHLKRNDPEAAKRLRDLAQTDPERARAWGWSAP